MKKARNVAGHYNHSSQAAEKLASLASMRGLLKCSLDNDVITRWWSTKALCESLVTLELEIRFLQSETAASCHLTEDDWLTIKAADSLLEPFMVVQRGLEGEHYVTNSLVIPLIASLREKLNAVIVKYTGEQDSELLAQRILPTAGSMLIVFNQKFGDGTRIVEYLRGTRQQPCGFYPQQVCATALDPRTKTLVGIPKDEKAGVWDLLLNECVSHMITRCPEVPSVTTEVSAGKSSLPKETMGLFDSMMCDEDEENEGSEEAVNVRSDIESSSPSLSIISGEDVRAAYRKIVELEIASYRATARLTFEDEKKQANNPLNWWKLNAVLYPNLAKYAKRVLAIPATSAPSERIFSVAGQIVTKKRNRLTGDSVTLLVWLHGAWEEVEKYLAAEQKKDNRKRPRE